MTDYERKAINKRGCASHSAASQQRIEQVIKELEGEKIWAPFGANADGFNEGIDCAIALLRGEQHE